MRKSEIIIMFTMVMVLWFMEDAAHTMSRRDSNTTFSCSVGRNDANRFSERGITLSINAEIARQMLDK